MRRIYILSIIFLPILVQANEQDINAPIPESVENLQHSMASQFEDASKEPPHHQFLEDSKVQLNLRNYYLEKKAQEFNNDNAAWSQGGSLAYQSGKFQELVSVKAEYFMSTNLYNPSDSTESQSSTAEQENYGVLGVLNPIVDLPESRLSLYRQRYNYAYLNDQFSRMTPNTFEGYSISTSPIDNDHKVQYIFGYIDKIKQRNAQDFISMSEAAGVVDGNKGSVIGGLLYTPDDRHSTGIGNFYTEDALNIFYTESQYRRSITKEVSYSLSGQFSEQRSIGDNLLTDEDFRTYMWGIRNALSYNNFILKLSFNSNSSDQNLRSPFGSYPSYTSTIIDDFNRAGESSWQTALSYNFSRIGFDGASISTSYTKGHNAISEETGEDLPNIQELDLTIDLKPESGFLKDFWFRIRGAHRSEINAESSDELRLIINYEIPLFGF